MRAIVWKSLGFGLLAGSFVVTACSAASTLDDDGATGAGAGNAGSGAGDASVGGSFVGSGGSNAGGSSACAADTFPGVQVPLDIHVMLDKSSSMQDASKWNNVLNALNTFFSDPGSAGIGVGLALFPVPPSVPPPSNCDSANPCGEYGPCIASQCLGAFSGDSCDVNDYATPVLPIGELPGAQASLQSALASASPNGSSTPTGKALGGARIYATQWAADHPTHLTYILFATDGDPTGCSGDAQGEAAAAAAANPPVKTFVIGVGPELTFLNGVAQAGGTGQAYLVDSGPGTTQQFLDALAEIRNTGACKFQIPEPTMGNPNYDLVNVTLKDPANPGSDITVGKVSGPGACGPSGGWYYDNEQNPSYIELCPASCDQVQSGALEVSVEIGCETIVQ